MTDAMDKTYNEGRLAFRQYFATCGPNVKQNDPRMPPNPHVGYYEGLAWLYGFESELRRHVVFTPKASSRMALDRDAWAAAPSVATWLYILIYQTFTVLVTRNGEPISF